jgi:lysophospholipase L1-like esterase
MRFPVLALLAALLGLPALASAETPVPATAAGIGSPCPDAALQRLAVPALRAAVQSGRPVTIVAFGSSSTEGSGASGPGHTYPARLEARLRAAWPAVPLRVVNRGIGGQDAQEMLARLEADVLAERPDLVIWQTGGNAAMRGMDPSLFRGLMAEGIARLQMVRADVVLMDNQRAPRIMASPSHTAFDATLAELASEQHVGLFSRGALMRQWEEAGVAPAAMLVGDSLHHNDRGYDCVAGALAQALVQAAGRPALIAGR